MAVVSSESLKRLATCWHVSEVPQRVLSRDTARVFDALSREDEGRVPLASCTVRTEFAGLRRLLCYFLGIGPQPKSQINDTIPLRDEMTLGQLAEDCVEITH